jgi:hypothetical protein
MWPPHVIEKWLNPSYKREELEWECCMHPFGYTPGRIGGKYATHVHHANS